MKKSWNTSATTARSGGRSWRRSGAWRTRRDADLELERRRLEAELGRPASDEDLVLYLQFPFDALSYFKFEAQYGKTWLLPPEVWFRRGGFKDGERLSFADEYGVPH